MPRVTILLAVSLMVPVGCAPDDDTVAVALATTTKTEAVAPAATAHEPSTAPLMNAPLMSAPLQNAPLMNAPLQNAPLMNAPLQTAPLLKALSGEPVSTCGVPRHRPLWRHALTSVANGLGLDSGTRLALYEALPSGVSHFLRR